ncbi:hypothetical protein JCM11251_007438 [Rhodosporidiobolus azoricus]
MANKENAFALTANSNPSSTTTKVTKPATRSRKPATGSGKLKLGATKGGKGKKGPVEEEEEEEEEEGEEDDEDEDELMAVADEEETVVLETQFDQPDDENDSGKKARGKKGVVAAKKAPAKRGAVSSKVKARAEVDEFEPEEEVGETKVSAREKKLAAQLEATKKALLDSQAAFTKLSELRSTRAEEAEAHLKEIADERQAAAVKTIESYKSESDALRSEVSSLQATAYSSPRSKFALLESRRVREVEDEKSELKGRVEELEREREERERERAEREGWWVGECERKVREVERQVGREARELKQELDTLRTELTAEVSHSKSLQAKLKSLPVSAPSSSLTGVPSTTTSSSSSSATAALQEEVERLTGHLNLNEDLTGFAVHAFKQEDVGLAYTCILNDAAGQTGGLNFKLTFHADSTVGYHPNVEPDRDAELMARLPSEMQGYMRFPAEVCAEWFKRLFIAVNKVRV